MKLIHKILLFLFTITLFIYMQIAVLQYMVNEIADLKQQVELLQEQNEDLRGCLKEAKDVIYMQDRNIEWLEREYYLNRQKTRPDEAHKAKDAETQKTNRGGEAVTSLGEYTITAYCGCSICCSKWANNRPGGKVIGAAGVELTPGVSVAAWLPFGTRLLIDGREYVVEDRTAGWIRDKYDGKIIDVYFADHETALAWGKQKMEVWIKEGDNRVSQLQLPR